MRRRERWMTREERDAMRDAIEEAGGVSAWIRQGLSEAAKAKQRA